MASSLVEPVTASPRRALAAYAAVATAARLGDAGAGIGVVLLAVDRDGPARGALVGGLLAAALTAPHALGPWTGRLLDSGRPGRVLAAACLVYAVALAAGVLALAAGPVVAAVPALVVAGAAGPLLTGGLSSLVGGLGGNPGRARGIDALTYGVAGTVGPAAVAALAAVASPVASLLVVAALVALAAPGVLLLPCPPAVPRPRDPESSSGVGLLFRSRPLRTVTVVTMATAAAGGAAAVVAVLLASETTGSARVGAWFVAALGIGNLVGAVVVTVRPWRGDPVRGGLLVAVALGLATAAVAAVPGVAVGLLTFAVVGVLTAAWVTATLAARDLLSPPERRGQVFVAMSGLKTAAGSGGTAVAGVVAAWGARPLALASGLLVLAAVAAVTLGPGSGAPSPP